MAKKIFFPIVLILLLLLSFWLGKVTGQRGKNTESGSHTEASSVAAKPVPETASHEHKEGEADVHAGDKQEGQGLKLSSEEKTNIGLKTVTADLRPIENVIRVAGVVKAHPDREAQVSSRVSGKIASLSAKVGDGVSKGQRLAEVQSAEIQKLQVELLQAENRLVLHKSELDRVQRLVESKIAAQKELIAAQNQHQAGLNEIEGLEKQLVLLGLPESAVKKTRAEKTIATFSIFAPISGAVEERNVVLGETVEPNKVIFKIVDPSTVFIEGSAFDEALPQLKIGQTVRIRLGSYPKELFTGKIARFSPSIDPQKRVLRLWAEVPNRGGKLKPNLFAEMDVVVGGGQEVLAIPLEALITTEGETFVFVEEKGSFRRAAVVVGVRDDLFVEVKSGLLPGDRVVTDGKQQIYTKSIMARQGGAALGGHGH